MSDLLNLIGDRLYDVRVGVTDTGSEHAAEAIEILLIILVPNPHALAASQGDRFGVIVGDTFPKILLMIFRRLVI